MNIATISSKYQVVIPREVREAFELKPGQKIAFIPYGDHLHFIIVPAIEDARGIFEGIDTDPRRDKIDRPL